MAPVRRYLRISSSSVLEVRIYLDNPSLSSSWLLRSRDPVLPRVIEAVRPLVLPKLREEIERDRNRGRLKAKKKGVKDVVVRDDFEVSIFLTPTTTRHSLLKKQKRFRDPAKPALTSTSNKLTGSGMTSDAAIEVADETDSFIPIIQEEDDDENMFVSSLDGIPSFPGSDDEDVEHEYEKRRRTPVEDFFDAPGAKRKKIIGSHRDSEDDDKKKLGMDISYDGFAIWGRVLCLIVKRRDTQNGKEKDQGMADAGGGKVMMEEWIASTQMPGGEEVALSEGS